MNLNKLVSSPFSTFSSSSSSLFLLFIYLAESHFVAQTDLDFAILPFCCCDKTLLPRATSGRVYLGLQLQSESATVGRHGS